MNTEYAKKNVLEIENLRKSFGEIHAVQDISFRVKEGELFAFLGVNGAGKSTTIAMICGELGRDGGEIRIDGSDWKTNPDSIKRKLGVVFQHSVLDRSLSVQDNLESRAALYGIYGAEFEKRLSELTELLSLEELLKRPLDKLSGGQRRRIDIARALLHRPKILILDEPTTGLDPQTRKNVWEVVSHLQKTEALTVFLTTHYMEEAADADYLVILDHGKIAAEGTPHELKKQYIDDYLTLYGVSEAQVAVLGYPYRTVAGGYRLAIPNPSAATALILSHPELFVDYEITKGKMDDVFLNVTGKILSEESVPKHTKGGKRG
ncbi:MAG: ABC transporter ATP-binding protein [Clostridia bacterium]|nr:ABC transporter ATP-binding protein [Clostridia bacterium]